MKRAVAVNAAPTAAANPTHARVIHLTASRRVIVSGSEEADGRALEIIFGSRADISEFPSLWNSPYQNLPRGLKTAA
jgi:hypothetical protein